MKQVIFCIVFFCTHGLFAQNGTAWELGTVQSKHFGTGGRITFLQVTEQGKVTQVGFFTPTPDAQKMTDAEFQTALKLLFEITPDPKSEFSEIFYILHMRQGDCAKGNYEMALRCLADRANNYLTSSH
jgi:hypothetical protein